MTLYSKKTVDISGSYHVSGGRLSAFHCGQSVWDLWGMKCQWDRFLSKYFSFPLSVSFHKSSILYSSNNDDIWY